MRIPLQAWILILLANVINCESENFRDELEFIESLRQKVRRLEQNGEIRRDRERYTEPPLRDGEIYDFIIVGAGSSGTALIYRLSEILHWKILVLEAGGEPDILTDIPFWSVLLHYTKQNWRYYTEREHNVALGLVDQRLHFPRGKGLGGSSLINYMVATRGVKEDYDKWASLGNPGWSYRDVFPIFKRMENCTLYFKDDVYRGHHGPIQVAEPYITTSGEAFAAAAQNAGYRYVDYNGKTNKGVSFIQSNLKNGLRCSGERCYIKPIKNIPNLTIRLDSHVTKILISHDTAYGVEYYKNGRAYIAYAQKEVILSAGAIGSPHILLLSGIGPAEQLLKFGIRPIRDLPVGQKLLDHPAYYNLGFTFNQPISFNNTDALEDRRFTQLFNEGTGPLTNIGTVEDILFTATTLAASKVTDIELLYTSASFSTNRANGFAGLTRVNDKTYDYTFKPYEGQYSGDCGVILLHQKSFGRIELRSADPFVHPKIYSGYFSDPGNDDVKVVIAGIREANRIMRMPPFDRYGIKPMDRPVYGCQHLRYDSDVYWECAIRHLASTVFHQTTTCKMGPPNDPEAVVDSRLRVYGIKDLRVVDTSIIPITLSAHTNIPAFMVGEKSADIIKEDHLFDYKSNYDGIY
ncbi:hypothetical protein Trydic_g2506 [Trypoxylus dichotomus]